MSYKYSAVVAGAMLLQACGGSDVGTTTPTLPNSGGEQPAPQTREQRETELLANITTLLNDNTCTDDVCDLVAVTFTPANDWSDEIRPRQRIMIIDSGMYTLSLTGYRNRVLDIYKEQEDMTLEPYRPTTVMPDSFNSVFEAIDDYGSFISVQQFRVLQSPENQSLLTKIGDSTGADTGHGYPIAAFILEHNPDAQVVLVEGDNSSYLYSPSEVCEQMLATDENEQAIALSLIQSRFDNYLQSLGTVVQAHQVDYINASWGVSRSIVQGAINRVCDGTPDDTLVSAILAIDHQFMDNLAQLSYNEQNEERPISLVQAGPGNYTRTLYEGDMDFPSDCDSSITNRIRVMDFMYKENDIPEYGTSDNNMLSENSEDAWDCVDVYLPLGQYFDDDGPRIRDKSMLWASHGFWEVDAFPLLSSSSMAAPVVLSSLIYQQSLVDERLSPQELFEAVSHNNKIIDPIQYDQFTAYSEGYRE